MNRPSLLLGLLALAVMGSAVAVVEVKHQSRSLFLTLESLRDSRDELNTAWSRLRLEQGALAMHSRVERIARDSLGLRQPSPEATTMLRLDIGEARP